jgi:hypothetical protein
MQLNLFKPIVFFLVLSASSFIIAHADTDVPFAGCQGLNICEEKNPAPCSAVGFNLTKIDGTYRKCPNCTNSGTFTFFTEGVKELKERLPQIR